MKETFIERWYNRAGTTALSSLGYYDPIGLISPRSHHRTSSTALSPPRWYHRAAIIALISPHSHHRDSTTGLSMFALFELFEQVPPCTFRILAAYKTCFNVNSKT
ncbi:hypothetical protein EVAR_6395_1 [Eumeta japonica]|uniref:Uncharacterized protein n=1 Tax=Eumeta variegata TaxID=151549 RepID=A0A4C1TFY8_EUMVA|nr:hypothetical protein EVAR_6395_1 [Eumeta japonica]